MSLKSLFLLRVFFFIFSLLFYLCSFSQDIDSIIARALRAYGGKEKFNDLYNLYKEGVFFEEGGEGREKEVMNNLGKKDTKVQYSTFKDYFIPFYGRRVENKANNSCHEFITIYNTKRGWQYKRCDTNNIISEINPVPKYKFLSLYFSTNKFSLYTDFMINSYSNSENTVYQGYEIRDGVRCIKLLCYNVTAVYLDAQTYLPRIVVEQYVDQANKKTIIIESKLEDYRKTDFGLVAPHRITQTIIGSSVSVVYKTLKMSVNSIENASTTILNTNTVRKLYLKSKTVLDSKTSDKTLDKDNKK